ncbi:MAG: DEAD/DEAH box helicase family protein [Clostridia bacterium]|nr:DEAD/DEAH box helicase family protein [Clostridia bacterium]
MKQAEAEEAKRLEDERIEEITSMDLPTDFENIWTLDDRAKGVHSESIDNGLILSLCNLGRVDIEYIASITGQEYKTVILALKGSIYQDPDLWGECFYKGWLTSDEYLSGNLIRKLRSAKEANEKYHGYFSDNVTALQEILPPSVATEDIYITLGSPWVPTDIIDDFITHLLGEAIKNLSHTASATKHDEETGIWEIPFKSRYRTTRFAGRSMSTYGTRRLEALSIIEKTLNQKTIAIFDEEIDYYGKKKKKLNQEETLLAIEKQNLIIKEFQEWVWLDKERSERLQTKYEDRYSATKVRHFDGSFLTFPNLNPEIQLYPYQKNAVARILFTPNTLLAHDVGSGKTYIMIAGGMELRRTGISKKNLYVVPNNLVGQWRDIFLHMYKDAKILTIEPKDFTPAKRYDALKKIRDEDYDGIIIAYSSFEMIPMSFEHRARVVEDEIEVYKRASSKLNSDKFAKQRERLQKELFEAHIGKREDTDIFFDELNINTIFLDEAHNYKNVPLNTQVERVLGISSGGSQKCQDMLEKIYHVQKTNGGRGAVLATGTPITNSVTDAFVMQKYLQSGELKMLGLSSFDGWIGMFAEKHTEFEIDIDTGSYRLATRFSRFHNLPELTSLFSSVADFHIVDKSVGVPDFKGYTDTITDRSYHFNDYLKVISKRADEVRSGNVKRNVDNLLLITTDGRKAALDMRLIDEKLVVNFGCKVAKCADNVYNIYEKTEVLKSTQLVFCDYSTPKLGFNLYDELKLLLVKRGIPENEIEYIHNAKSERAREKLFKAVREGKIRVLIGSTFKLGLGVNVQDKLIAIHHLDVPWRPADMTQREGRILRQGNTNPQIFIYRYITEGSFDAYSWQLLETKQRFISSLLSGHLSERDGSDVSDIVLNYAEIKAIAVGNPRIKERVETANELDKQIILRRERIRLHEALSQELNTIPSKIKNQEKLLMSAYEDLATLHDNDRSEKIDALDEQRRNLRDMLDSEIKANILSTEEKEITEYRGFKLALPAGMREEEPYIWLVGSGRYVIELGDSKLGYLKRIDNFLDSFTKHISRLKDGLELLKAREEYIESTLSEPDIYSDRIEELKAKIEKIDEALGVNKKK